MTLVILLNVLLVGLVLVTIVGLHAWAIRRSQIEQQALAGVGARRARRRNRQTTARRLRTALAPR